jgi:hypothetical protein
VATAKEALEWVGKLHKELSGRRAEIKQSFDYFEGKQPLVYATEQWKAFHQERYKDFSDNWCGVVGRAPVDRLRIDGFRLGTSADIVSADERQLWADWNRNELGAQSNQGFLASTIAKRSAVLVWGDDNDEPVVSWESPEQVIVAYSTGGRRERLAALKSWREGDEEFATLYMPTEVWKFKRAGANVSNGRTPSGIHVTGPIGGGGWTQRVVAGEKWPLGNPLGEVPIVEWLNRPMLGGKPISDIAGVIAMQDAINTLWAYLFNSADQASMAARVITGAEAPKVPVLDENGQIVGSKPARMEDLAQGKFMYLGKDARIDQWDAAKLDVFTGVITQGIGHVAAQTSTPGHYLILGEKFANLNGDALTAAEVPLATKVENQHTHFNPSSKDTARLMALVRGNKDLAQAIRETDSRRFTQWKDAGMHSLSQVADAATKDKSVGMSLRTILERRYGMTEEEIDREFDRIKAEQSDPFLLLDPVTAAAVKGAASGNADAAAGA